MAHSCSENNKNTNKAFPQGKLPFLLCSELDGSDEMMGSLAPVLCQLVIHGLAAFSLQFKGCVFSFCSRDTLEIENFKYLNFK